ncbi:MAG: pkb-activating kinase-like protein [Trichoglossum hirsutum]|nr:MAG: pkb-activating kinase-like protein [Trichoglossum hirsutum]
MDGDLSLSQSFGGLRIANPDDADPTQTREDPTHLPSLPPLQFSPAFQSTPAEQDRRPNLAPPLLRQEPPRTPSPDHHHTADGIAGSPASTGDAAPHSSQGVQYVTPNTNRRSVMYPAQQQQQQQYHPQSSPPGIQQSGRMFQQPPSSGPRPSSAIFPQPSSNAFPDTTLIANGNSYAEYRLTSQSSRSSTSGLPPSNAPRNSSTSTQASVPTRGQSYNDRSYGQSHIRNGPLPPRRSSRGQGRGHMGMTNPPAMPAPSGSPYDVDGGPLPSSDEWKDRGAAVGVRQELDRNGNPVQRYVKKGVKDFNFGRTLGEGSYSTVLAATDRQTLKEYAIKVLDKRHIIKERKVKYVNIEKNTLNRLGDHPGIVRLYYTFQDERSLYYVLDVASGGELLGVLKRMGTFDEECARYYGAQILDAVEYMHSRGVIHRDLKPENVLLDDQMHVKITDFGTAKILDPPRQSHDTMNGNIPYANQNQGNPMDSSDDNRANSFVGTAEYVSPELLTDKNACKASDLWAFGCIIYQLLSGRPPFKAANEYQTFQKIVSLDYEFPKGFPAVAKDLVERLLVLDPAKRLTIEHVKNHQFFDGIIWGRVLWKQKAPRLKSYVPPAQEPNVIKLNDFSDSTQQNTSKNGQGLSSGLNGSSRPQPRVITELPPPSQLDIEWSPVLTRTNERILKLGNLAVSSAPAPQSPVTKNGLNGENTTNETPKKFSRFFGGNTSKKRQRLVMVTSSARIILAAAGGDDKRAKTEISLLAPGTSWRSTSDAKGVVAWCVDTKDKHYTFEDIKASSDPTSAQPYAQEWLDTIESAKDLAISQNLTNTYSSEDAFNTSNMSSPSSTLVGDTGLPFDGMGRNGKNQLADGEASTKSRKRFSKRHSKSGLAAVF